MSLYEVHQSLMFLADIGRKHPNNQICTILDDSGSFLFWPASQVHQLGPMYFCNACNTLLVESERISSGDNILACQCRRFLV